MDVANKHSKTHNELQDHTDRNHHQDSQAHRCKAHPTTIPPTRQPGKPEAIYSRRVGRTLQHRITTPTMDLHSMIRPACLVPDQKLRMMSTSRKHRGRRPWSCLGSRVRCYMSWTRMSLQSRRHPHRPLRTSRQKVKSRHERVVHDEPLRESANKGGRYIVDLICRLQHKLQRTQSPLRAQTGCQRGINSHW